MILFYDPHCADYGSSERPEQPARVLNTVPLLQAQHPQWEWRQPAGATEELVRLAHTEEHLRRLERPRDFDADTPFFPGILQHALQSVGAAVAAMTVALEQEKKAFALMRPPGHHASASQAMGFCYLNQIAIAALAARQRGAERVAIWDFDAHHGNGTEAILEGRDGLRFVSVHQYPGYPYTGTRSTPTCRNWAVPPYTPRQEHMEALEQSWDAVQAFRPDLVLVSAGFDAYCDDPITAMTLEQEDFAQLGVWMRQADFPSAAVLEGGYSEKLPQLIEAFLREWDR